MADQKIVDNIAGTIGNKYEAKLKKIVNTVHKAASKVDKKEAVAGLMTDETKKALQASLQELIKDYAVGHKKVLKTVKPFGKTKNDRS